MKLIYLKNFRKGFATNSSSTHSLIYKNEDDMFNDLNVMELNYYDRFDETIAASREAKIKYIAANIMHQKDLFNVMCAYYPEMKQYEPLIKEQLKSENKDIFGMCARGLLYIHNSHDLQANIDNLKYIIDNDDVIIVGGSDETDFVYDTKENHKEIKDAEDIDTKYEVVKNGNYWVGMHRWDGNRIRFAQHPDNCIPEYPELIDLKITNMCEHGCKFCYMGSNIKGKHADIKKLKAIIMHLSSDEWSYYNKRVEFAIGGGNILLYPDLEELFKFIKDRGHIINTTINIQDVKKLYEDKSLQKIFNAYVSGVGISVCCEDDIKLLEQYNIEKVLPNCKFVLHIIPEMIGIKETRKIVKAAYAIEYYNSLFLGYKTNNRGSDCEYKIFNNSELEELFDELYCIGVDTTFANRYYNYISENYPEKYTLTRVEGEYSMFIDAVEMKAYKSSYQLDKPYNLEFGKWDERRKTWFDINEAFAEIRKDNGLKAYEKSDYR